MAELSTLGSVIATAYEAEADKNAFTDAEKAKLAAIEAAADVTDTANVTAAGALMDSEITNLAAVKAFDPADYATAAQGTTADAALPKAGGQITGNITCAAAETFDGRDLSVDGAKLDGIEAGATADQSASEILTAIKTVDGTGSGLDADLLDGNEASAFVTPATNKPVQAIVIACSDETTALTTGLKVTFRMPYAFTLTDIKASVTTAPTGASLIADVHEGTSGGTSIMTTNKLAIEAGEFTTDDATTQPTLTDTALAEDAEMTVYVDQIGASVAGAGLKVTLIGTRT